MPPPPGAIRAIQLKGGSQGPLRVFLPAALTCGNIHRTAISAILTGKLTYC
ncbi:hypothetical protein APASM_0669 [Actinosynnema pretiosum subsp. pretiosum]|nr:hypothetical protein APASM_0669 [Actinosynnema pretiosum subsp. pretiosum]